MMEGLHAVDWDEGYISNIGNPNKDSFQDKISQTESWVKLC